MTFNNVCLGCICKGRS